MCNGQLAFWPLLICVAIVGCGEKKRGGDRLDTTSVTGEVYVDGEPASGILIQCFPISGSEIKYELACYSDESGQFALGTYESGDGVPPGKYALTFQWSTMGGLGGPKDKLRGRYANPKKTDVTVDVVAGEPVELDRVELSTKDP